MAVRNRVSKLTNGCKCHKNNCKTKQCGCKKICGPGCQCINYDNLLPAIDASTTASESELFFQDESLLVGEEIEVREVDESDTHYDSSSDTETNSDEDI